MIFAGCDVGSLTAKAVLIKNNSILAFQVERAKATPLKSATLVLDRVLKKAGINYKEIKANCATGYGRDHIPFASTNISEISAHALGVHFLDKTIKTVIDIGGQDAKVISLDNKGGVQDFIMNDKCAAGTGRSLEVLAKALNIDLKDLGPLSLRSWRPVEINNKCSIFMELEVLQALYRKKKIKNIAAGINDAVARRVASLAASIESKPHFALTGGVAKNIGVMKKLEKIMKLKFIRLRTDPQIIGALGAALFVKGQEE